MTQKGSNWQQARNAREMTKTYVAAEWLLQSKLDDVGYMIAKLLQESVTLSVNAEYGKQFLYEKVMMLLDESVKKHAERNVTN